MFRVARVAFRGVSSVQRSATVAAVRQASTSTGSRVAGSNFRTLLPWAVGVGAASAFAAHQAFQNPIHAEKKANAGVLGTNTERSFIMIKPDGVQRALIAEIISRFENKGFKLVALKMITPSKELAAKHYDDLKTKPFFKGLVEYMSCGTPVIAMVWEGRGVIKTGRVLLGATNPNDSAPGTIRGDLAISIGRNIIHGSDSFESASDEIALWFTDSEINDWKQTMFSWIAEVN